MPPVLIFAAECFTAITQRHAYCTVAGGYTLILVTFRYHLPFKGNTESKAFQILSSLTNSI